jgi:hypothetical protein
MTETSNVHRLNIPRRRLPSSTLLESSEFVLMVEEDNEAMAFFGPFPSQEMAMNFAEVTLPDLDSRVWWVTELEVPHTVEGIGREGLVARGWREGLNGMLKEFPRSPKVKIARPPPREPSDEQRSNSARNAQMLAQQLMAKQQPRAAPAPKRTRKFRAGKSAKRSKSKDGKGSSNS